MPQSAGRGLAAWPIRRKLVALVAVPILVIVAVGAWLTTSSVTGLRQAERTKALAQSALATNDATIALDAELTATLVELRSSTPATTKVLADTRVATDRAFAALKSHLAQAPSGGWSGDVLMAANGMELSAQQLSSVRKGADAGTRSPLVIETSFQSVFVSLRNLTAALSRGIATSTAEGGTVDQASMLAALAAAAAAAADERATGTIAMGENRLSDRQLATIQQLAVEQNVQLQIANDHATPEQQSDIDAIRMDDQRMSKFRDDLVDLNQGVQQDPTAFSEAAGQRLRNLDALIGRVAVTARDSAADGVRAALISTIVIGGVTVLVLLLIFATLAAIARTVTGPMRRLRSGAVEVATVRLPQAVRQIEQQGIDATIDLPPVMPPGTVAGPETLEVAHAVDGLTAEAVRLATAQVRLRHALDEAFVSMSRRSQTMVEKQLAIIDELESTEEDPEQLRNLFRLDHLAARMRRYNDNLLVLAGSSVRTRSNTPVPVSDVFRAATSEMEQYERVRLQPVNSAAVGGPVAGGLIHLLAELLDNAAMYSPPTSPILLTAAFTPGGGLHLEVTDSGVGIPPAELAELNARLATPGTIDTQIPSRMGLFVVGRLAQRGGFEVRLSARASAAGTVAEVLVPAVHVVGAPQGGQETPLPGRMGAPAQRTPGPLSPQGLPGLPPMGASPIGMGGSPALPPGMPPARPPMGFPPAPAGAPRAGLPPTAMPSPNLPRRPNLVWPGSEQKGAEAASGPATGSLPSRVPGAALSGGPLSAPPGRNGAPGEPPSAFDAFGSSAGSSTDLPPIAHQAPPPGATPIGPHSATAAWSAQARAARGAGPAGPAGPAPARQGEPSQPSFGPFSGGAPQNLAGGPASPAPLPSFAPSAPLPPFAPSPGAGSGPSGPDGGPGARTPFAAPGGPRTEEPGVGGPNGLPTRTPNASFPPPPPVDSALPSFAPPREDRDAPGAGRPNTLPPVSRERDEDPQGLPTRHAQSDDPFGTAKLFGVEMPDPATAKGLFTAGPKIGEPAAPTAFNGGHGAEPDARDDRGPGYGGSGYGGSGYDGSGSGFVGRTHAELPPATGELPRVTLKPESQQSTAGSATSSNGTAPAAWNTAPDNAAPRYTAPPAPPAPPAPASDPSMIGNLDYVTSEFASPIFESMSAWFSAPAASPAPSTDATDARPESGDVLAGGPLAGGFLAGDDRGALADQGEDLTESLPAVNVRPGDGGPGDRPAPAVHAGGKPGPQDASRLIDLREDASASAPASMSSRWASLGDQQWLAANARAASAPQVAGDTSAGLPRREPGANLLPSAASAAPSTSAPSAPVHRADADVVRGRLGSYQRGVSSARQSTSRHVSTSTTAASLFTAARTAETDQGHEPDEQGGEQ